MNDDYIVAILTEFLGSPHSHNSDKGQVSFDCPACAEDKGLMDSTDGKHNLEVNYKLGVFKCWACQHKNNTKGVLPKLFYKYGNKELLKRFDLIKPQYSFNNGNDDEKEILLTSELPKEYLKFNEENKSQEGYNDALKYLRNRGITDEIIDRYQIGFINRGREYKNRIIIPSFDINGGVTYFNARAFYSWMKPKYRNPETPKEELIFNHSLINPYGTIYLVEGVFDSITLPNSIPLLGLVLHEKLYWYLQNNAKANVVIILDGEAKESAEYVYKQLNTLKLYKRVKIVYLKEGLDMSLIFEKYGKRGLKAVLKSQLKLKEMNYSL